jgi:predicted dehydrogenase
MNIGIIGCGLIGTKRALNLLKEHKLVSCFDFNQKKSKLFSKKFKCSSERSIDRIIKNNKIKLVIVATYHSSLFQITKKAMLHDKFVMVEKPASINVSQIKSLLKIEKIRNSKVKVGFNHRYLQSIIKAKKIIEEKYLGNILYIRSRYGHGGRINYQNEWRMKPNLSGGGELIDQGSHIIDLTRFFLGNVQIEKSSLFSIYWKKNVDDNSILILKNKKNQFSLFHVSCTEWKNKFSVEIFCEIGKIEINGIGGSYGQETLKIYKMGKKLGKPKLKKYTYKKNLSWKNQMIEFNKEIISNCKIKTNLLDALENLKIIKKAYRLSDYDYLS